MKTTAIMATAALFFAGCQSTDPVAQEQALVDDGWQPMDRAGVLAATTDTTHSGTVSDGRAWSIYYMPDGAMRGTVGNEADVGSYTVSDAGVYCRSWNTFVNGREGCARLYQRGNEIKAVKVSGAINLDEPWSFEPGNTRNL